MRGQRSSGWLPVTVMIILLLTLVTGCGAADDTAQKLSSGVSDAVFAPEFKHSTWGIYAADLKTGEDVIESLNPDMMFDPASTTKLFTVATALDVLGPDYRFETPVYRTGEVGSNGSLDGDLVLVASGDLAMGGRITPDGHIEYTSADHNDANALESGVLTAADPLTGLNDLARQVAESGINKVNGDILIDARLYGPGRSFSPGEEYIITPIMINDNLIDLTIKPTQPGSPATVDWRPHSAAYHVESRVNTVAEDQKSNIEISSTSPGLIVVEGQVAQAAGDAVRTYQVEEPASFARTLFIEALQRAGVTVDAPETGENAPDRLPAEGVYSGMEKVAALESPPFKEYAKLIMKVSHNLGADTLLYLIAVHQGERTMEDGLRIEHDFLKKAGVDTSGAVINDGQGAYGANLISPRTVVQFLHYMSTRSDFDDFRDTLPVLGEDGSLALVLTDSPARGKVQAKTGTHFGGDEMNNRPFVYARALGGYMTTSSGRELVFYVNVNNVPLESMDKAKSVIDDHAGIIETIYEEY